MIKMERQKKIYIWVANIILIIIVGIGIFMKAYNFKTVIQFTLPLLLLMIAVGITPLIVIIYGILKAQPKSRRR